MIAQLAVLSALFAPPPVRAAPLEDPSFALGAYAQALAAGDAARAKAALAPAVSARSGSYPLVLRYAYVHYLLKEYASAEALYRRAAALAPEEEAPLAGLMLLAQTRSDPAWREFARSVLTLNPYHRDAGLALAYDAFSRKDYRGALEGYGALLANAPNDTEALTGRGWSALYLGERGAARGDFVKAARLDPAQAPASAGASARQGLASARLWTAGVGACFFSIDYSGNAFKSGARYGCLPVSFDYLGKLWGGVTYSETRVDWTDPSEDTKQSDITLMLGVSPRPWLSAWSVYDAIDSNDSSTDGGRSLTGGIGLSRPLGGDGAGTLWWVSGGAAVSHSHYRDFDQLQISPKAGLRRGRLYGELFGGRILKNGARESLDSWGGMLAVGPASGFGASLRGWRGRKYASVEEGGALVYNALTDTLLEGWQAGVGWSGAGLSVSLRYGRDEVEADYSGRKVRYRAESAGGSVQVSF